MSRISYAPARDELRTVCWRRVNEKCLLWDPPPGIQAPDSPLAPVLFLVSATLLGGNPRVLTDDRLSLDPLGRVEGGDGIVEGSHVADVCPQPTIPGALNDLTQLEAIGYDDEVDSQAASGPRISRAGDRHQGSSGANQARRPLRDVAAEDIENQIDPADIF